MRAAGSAEAVLRTDDAGYVAVRPGAESTADIVITMGGSNDAFAGSILNYTGVKSVGATATSGANTASAALSKVARNPSPAVSTSTGWGYSTSTQADAIVTGVNALITRAGVLTTQGNAFRTNLIELGLIVVGTALFVFALGLAALT